jgi:hypothetical protein
MQHTSNQKQVQAASPYQYAPLLPVPPDGPMPSPQPPAPVAKQESAESFQQQDPEAQLVEELLRQAKQQASATTNATKGRALEGF